jgi:hypothetical protein
MSLALTRRPARTAVWLVPLTALTLTLLTGCSSNNQQSEPSPTGSAPDATTSSTPTASTTPNTSDTAADINKLTGGKTVELTTDTLPAPPDGYTQAEVTAFAERAIELVQRGMTPDLSDKSPRDAFNYVFANQYPASTKATQAALQAAAGDYDWEWSWATRFDTKPSEPAKVLVARWQVETVPNEQPDGRPMLQVSLATATEHLIPDTPNNDSGGSGDTTVNDLVPVVARRTVIIQGTKPLGGPDWWPAIGIQSENLFGGKCVPVNGSIITPAHDPATIREDLATLRTFIKTPNKVNAGDTNTSIADYVKNYCED